jgi:hypothetical protein
VHFDRTRVPLGTEGWLPGWTTRPARSEEDEDPNYLYLVRSEDAATSPPQRSHRTAGKLRGEHRDRPLLSPGLPGCGR